MSDSEKTKVLFVDDEHIICTMASEILELFGYEIDIFEESKAALESFKKKPDFYDIVVTDQTMPQLSGYEMLSEIIKIRKNIPKILCTGYSDQFEDLKKNVIGIDALFRKPYHFEDLIEEIKKLV